MQENIKTKVVLIDTKSRHIFYLSFLTVTFYYFLFESLREAHVVPL